jgi:MGT family glycosyltransferase
MTHFGIICPAAAGHLNPMTTLGYELQKRGHRVTLFGIPDAQPKTLAAGLEFKAVGEEKFPIGTTTETLAQLGQLNGIAAFQYTVALFKQGTVMLLQDAPEAIKETGVEALLIDQTSFGGETVAEHLDIPFISVCSALMLNREPGVPPFNTTWNYNQTWWAHCRNSMGYRLLDRIARPITEVVAEYRQAWNLPPFFHSNDFYSKLAQLTQQPVEFEFPRQDLPQCFHFTGPYHNPSSREPAPFPFDKLTGQPLIYASMGTVQNRLMWVFQAIAEACAGLDAQLIIALGSKSELDALPELPGSPLVVGYAPQLELLQRATLTITHAGMNTTLESLSNGVPMVAIPIANDQPGVAARIVWTGTGEAIPLKRLSVPKLQRAIERVLAEDLYKKNALRLQQAIHQVGGVTRAVEIIEQVISTGNPLSTQIT